MASIQKRGNSYLIKVSCGYNCKGKQMVQTMTWKPEPEMTCKQIEKEVNRQAVMFEEACNQGYQSVAVKFETFCEEWFESYAKYNLRNTTYERMRRLRPRIYSAIGHIRMDKMNPRQIQAFINTLASEGANQRTGQPLSPKTIKHYYSLISEVYSYAEKMEIVSQNPCKKVSIPKGEYKEKEIYSPKEIQKILYHLESEPMKYQVFFTLMIYSGFRRSEMLGLEWKDIDWKNNLLRVVRTSEYTKEKGIYTDTPKTESSKRFIKLPPELMQKLKEFRDWQDEYKDKLGTKWIECDRLFTKLDGSPMGMRQPYKYFERFCERTGMRFVNVHSFRHFNASILINNGVDVKTVQGCLGHSCATTTLNIYAHSFQEAQARAMDSVASCILKKREA